MKVELESKRPNLQVRAVLLAGGNFEIITVLDSVWEYGFLATRNSKIDMQFGESYRTLVRYRFIKSNGCEFIQGSLHNTAAGIEPASPAKMRVAERKPGVPCRPLIYLPPVEKEQSAKKCPGDR